MTQRVLVTMMAFGMALPAAAQEPAKRAAEKMETREREMQMMGEVRAKIAVEARTTKGAPYSADAVTESTQTLADGNRINHKLTMRIYRDSEGRTRREEVNENGVARDVSIVDPVAHTSFMLQPESRTAYSGGSIFVMHTSEKIGGGGIVMYRSSAPSEGNAEVGRGGAVVAYRASESPETRQITTPEDQAKAKAEIEGHAKVMQVQVEKELVSIAATPSTLRPGKEEAPGQTTHENLGTRNIEGVAATGTRTTTTIPAGAIGNDQPIAIVSEEWLSTDLQVLVLTKHSDPRAGETTYRLLNVVRAEPDRSLFTVPSDFTIKESGIRHPAPDSK